MQVHKHGLALIGRPNTNNKFVCLYFYYHRYQSSLFGEVCFDFHNNTFIVDVKKFKYNETSLIDYQVICLEKRRPNQWMNRKGHVVNMRPVSSHPLSKEIKQLSLFISMQY